MDKEGQVKVSEKLSKHQAESLSQLKKAFGSEWFCSSDLLWKIHIRIRRQTFTLETLHKKGTLERRMNPGNEGVYSDDFWQYRVTP